MTYEIQAPNGMPPPPNQFPISGPEAAALAIQREFHLANFLEERRAIGPERLRTFHDALLNGDITLPNRLSYLTRPADYGGNPFLFAEEREELRLCEGWWLYHGAGRAEANDRIRTIRQISFYQPVAFTEDRVYLARDQGLLGRPNVCPLSRARAARLLR